MTLFRSDNVMVIVRRLIPRIGKGVELIPSREDRLTDDGPLPLTEGEGAAGWSRQHFTLLAGMTCTAYSKRSGIKPARICLGIAGQCAFQTL